MGDNQSDDLDKKIYDWNMHSKPPQDIKPKITVDDETLRDGLQSPSTRNPGINEKKDMVKMMAELGIQTADLGLPGSGVEAVKEIDELVKFIVTNKLKLQPRTACRTHSDDLGKLSQLIDDNGVPIYCDMFIGSSPIRRYAEDWSFEDVKDRAKKSLNYTLKNGIPTMFVVEDATRSKPEELEQLYLLAIDCGVKRLCITDTVGFAVPEGARALVRFTKSVLEKAGVADTVGLDWHGHRDRGLALACTMAAIDEGVDQVHGCVLGLGERSGNTALELILVNLYLLGLWNYDLHKLPDYCRLVSHAVGMKIAQNRPVVGRDAFITSTGVHAAAIIKAKKRGKAEWADLVYSSVPASDFGYEQIIRIGFMSGKSNVVYVLNSMGIDPSDELCNYILVAARKKRRQLEREDILDLIEKFDKRSRKLKKVDFKQITDTYTKNSDFNPSKNKPKHK